jgi:hypothetical protein
MLLFRTGEDVYVTGGSEAGNTAQPLTRMGVISTPCRPVPIDYYK